MPLWILKRCLLLGAIVGLSVLSNPVLSQTSSTSNGPKFQSVGERSGLFERAPTRAECEFISHNLRFCAAGSAWELELEPIRNGQALYQFSESRRASLTVVPMKEDASRKLSPVEVVELLHRQIFSDGPRGEMEIEVIVEDEKTANGTLLHRRAFVTDHAGHSHLLQVTVLPFDYGLGFLETTIEMPATSKVRIISEEDIAFHEEFLNKTRVRTSILR